MPTQQELEDAKEQAVSAYLRGPDKTSKVPPGFGRNVIGIGIGPKIKRGQAPGDTCVHFYVERKLQPAAVPHGFMIEEKLGNVQTDVIETGRFVSFQSEAPKPLAAPGSSIGLNYMGANVDPTITGTLGGFVKINGDYYVIGSNHAMTVNGRVPADTRILFKPPDQFIDDPNKYILASTTVYVPLIQTGPNYVDCALAKVENSELVATEFPKWIVGSNPVPPEKHMKVSRVNDTDNATGVIRGVNARVSRIYYRFGTYEFDDLVLIEGDNGQFARPGDSGAILVDEKNNATALVIGGSSKYTIACPLATAISELEAALDKLRGRFADALPATIELVVNSWRDRGASKPTTAGGS